MSKEALSHRRFTQAQGLYRGYAWTQNDEDFRVRMVLDSEPKTGGDPLRSLATPDGSVKICENNIHSKWFSHSPLSRIYHYTHTMNLRVAYIALQA